MAKMFRAAVIGSSRKGGYGHGLDTCFDNVARAQVVAVADDDPAGLQAAGKRLDVRRLYADFRELLRDEKPDVVSIGPRWVTERVAMIEAAAAAGCHIFCEKPFVGDLVAADSIIAACQQADVKLALAHQFRAAPPVQKALADLRAGKFGKLLRVRARPKDDARGGGEELVVHGTHLFDLMIAVAGAPRWVQGHVTSAGRDVTVKDARQGTEPVGPIAGDSIAATIGFDGGVRGSFDSTVNVFRNGKSPYGLWIECEQAILHVRSPGDVFVYPAPQVVPEDSKLAWEKIWIADWHFTPEHQPRPMNDWLSRGNQILVNDLLDAVEQNRDPLSSLQHGLWITEIIQGVYASHLSAGRRVPIPQTLRRHPLSA